nr:uncharacterized protein LOC111510866 [Leptinotarsa decemlineata]
MDSTLRFVTPLAAGAVQTGIKRSSFPKVPPFKPIPPADERPTITSASSLSENSLMGILPSSPSGAKVMAVMAVPKKRVQAQEKISSNNFAVRTLSAPNHDLPVPILQHSSNSIHTLLAANNVTEEAMELALIQRQQILSRRTTTSTTTTSIPASKYAKSVGKVMNAPKEYYPVGYDKNFDDNFASRVELPDTSFSCGDQKHFPGLYADEDLGCMVSVKVVYLYTTFYVSVEIS